MVSSFAARRGLFLALLGGILTIVAVACAVFRPAPTPLATVSPQQHIIFHDGAVLTMDGGTPRAEAVEVTGQKITAVGNDEAILARRRAETRVVDLDGRTLMPGFVDDLLGRHGPVPCAILLFHWQSRGGGCERKSKKAALFTWN